MITYPISSATFNRASWENRTNVMQMLSFQVQKDNLPIVIEFSELLSRIIQLPLDETLADENVQEYFFSSCFPSLCQRLIKSKYFKDQSLLVYSNKVLQLSIQVFLKYFHFIDKYLKFAYVLQNVFNHDHMYFEHNNQMTFQPYPWAYYKDCQNPEDPFMLSLKAGDQVDVMKYDSLHGVACWSRATILEEFSDFFNIEFHNTLEKTITTKLKSSFEFSPFKTKSHDFDWRLGLTQGDQVDCIDKRDNWYRCTVANYKQTQNGKVVLLSWQKLDDEDLSPSFLEGENKDNGIDVTSPQIQPPGKILKFITSQNKSIYKHVQSKNDHMIYNVGNKNITVTPRTKYKSQTLFFICRKFIEEGGMGKLFEKLRQNIDPNLLITFFSAIGGISNMFHVQYAQQMYKQMRSLLDLYTSQTLSCTKLFHGQNTRKIFRSISTLFKIVIGKKQYQIYEANLKKLLVKIYLNNQTEDFRQTCIDLVNTIVSHPSEMNHEEFRQWFIDNKIFSKLILNNSSSQQLKKTKCFFQFMISKDFVSEAEMISLFNISQKAKSKIKMAIYKLLQDSVGYFKQNILDCLVNKILQIERTKLGLENLGLLMKLTTLSKSFPPLKAIVFLETLMFNHTLQHHVVQWLIKQYSSQFVQSFMKEHWKEHINIILNKFMTDKVETAIELLYHIVVFVGTGEEERYKILEYINSAKFQKYIIESMINNKDSTQYPSICQKVDKFIREIVSKLGLINITASFLIKLYETMILNNKSDLQNEKFKSISQFILSNKDIFDIQERPKIFQWFEELTSLDNIQKLDKTKTSFILSLFIFTNLVEENFFDPQIYKLLDKTQEPIQRLASLNELKYYSKLVDVIYKVKDKDSLETLIQFYKKQYRIDNDSEEIRIEYLSETLADLEKFYETKQYLRIERVILIINIIIDESEQNGLLPIKPLLRYRKGQKVVIKIRHYRNEEDTDKFRGDIDMLSNETLFDLKRKVASLSNSIWKQIEFSWQQLNPNSLNKTLTQLSVNLDTLFFYSKVNPPPNHKLLDDSKKLNPKARDAFIKIFDRFKINGLMTKQQCKKLIVVCLGHVNVKTYDDRIQTLYSNYDDDQDCQLRISNFLDFFEQACDVRPTTVWLNLKSLNFRYDFEDMDNVEADALKLEYLPRNYLSTNQKFVNMLFDLVQQQCLTSTVWALLQNLAVNSRIYQQLYQLSVEEILNIKNPYRTLYYLYIISNLIDTNIHIEEIKIKVKQKLIKQNICGKLLYFVKQTLYGYNNLTNKSKDIKLRICDLILEITQDYFMNAFKTKSNLKSHDLIMSNDLDFIKLNDDTADQTTKKSISWHEQNLIQVEKAINLLVQSLLIITPEKSEFTEVSIKVAKKILNLLLTFMLYQKDCSQFLSNFSKFVNTIELSINKSVLKVIYCLAFSQELTNQQEIIFSLINYLESQNQSNLPGLFLSVITKLVEKFPIKGLTKQTQNNLINKILTSKDQQKVKSCAVVLSNTKIIEVTSQDIKKIWVNCLFNQTDSFKSDQVTRKYLYELLLDLVCQNADHTELLNSLMMSVFDPYINQWKTMTQQQLQSKLFNYKQTVGLRNGKSKSMLASFIQLLYFNQKIKYFVLNHQKIEQPNDKQIDSLSIEQNQNQQREEKVLNQLIRIFRYLQLSERRGVCPERFIEAIKDCSIVKQNSFDHFDQKITQLLLLIQKSLQNTTSKDLIDQLFRGKIISTSKCHSCSYQQFKQKDFLCLNLNLSGTESMTIDKLFKKWVTDISKQCPNCQQISVAKNQYISRFPKVLLIAPNRREINDKDQVCYNQESFTFDSSLDLQNASIRLMKQQQINQFKEKSEIIRQYKKADDSAGFFYQLKGLTTFTGTSQNSRFNAYIKIRKDELYWYSFNGSNVQQFDKSYIKWLWFGKKDQNDDEMFQLYNGNSQDLENSATHLLVYYKQTMKSKKCRFDQILMQQQESDKNDNQSQPQLNQNVMIPIKQDIYVIPQHPVKYSHQVFDKEIQQDNLLMSIQNTVCSEQLVHFFSNYLLLPNLSKQTLRQSIEFSFKMLLKIWLTQQNKSCIISSINSLLESNKQLSSYIIKSKHFKALILLEKQRQAAIQLKLLALKIITHANSDLKSSCQPLNQNVLNILGCKKQLLSFGNNNSQSIIICQIEFWIQLLQSNFQSFAPFCLQHNIIARLTEQLLMNNEKGIQNWQIIKSNLQQTIFKLLIFAKKSNNSEALQNCKYIFQDQYQLQKIIEHHSPLVYCIIQFYCVQDLKFSEYVIRTMLLDPKGKIFKQQTTLRQIYHFIGISDKYQVQRVKLIVGTPRLKVNYEQNTIACAENKTKRYFNYISNSASANNFSILDLYLCSDQTDDTCKGLFIVSLFDQANRYPAIKQYLQELPPPMFQFQNLYDCLKQSIKKYLSDKNILDSLQKELSKKKLKDNKAVFGWKCLLKYFKNRYQENFPSIKQILQQDTNTQNNAWKDNEYLVCDEYVEGQVIDFFNKIENFEKMIIEQQKVDQKKVEQNKSQDQKQTDERFKTINELINSEITEIPQDEEKILSFFKAQFQSNLLKYKTIHLCDKDLPEPSIQQEQETMGDLKISKYHHKFVVYRFQEEIGQIQKERLRELCSQKKATEFLINGLLVKNTSPRKSYKLCYKEGVKFIKHGESLLVETDKIQQYARVE